MDILIPELSESVRSGTVVKVSVGAGDRVSKGQTLLELETEKAVLEVPSPAEGIISEILIKQGDVVQVGQAVFRISSEKTPEPPKAEAATAPQAAPSAPPVPSGKTVTHTASDADVPAAPSVRRFARENGVDITQVTGTGEGGRISIDDVTAYMKKSLGTPPVGNPPAIRPLPDFEKQGAIVREPMSAIRKTTAEHMAYAWATIPHVTHFAKADITELDKLRRQISTEELKLTVTPFVIKVVAAALRNFPKLNASIDMAKNEVIYKKFVNIGCAVDTEHGLLVPVIRDADKKSILELAGELKALSDKARARKLSLEDMNGGTFTVTNLGGITGGHFTPIINGPEVAILGISRAELEPCYDQGPACAPRLMLPLSLSYDHRLVDGADAARFIQWVTDAIRQPFLLELK